MEIPQQLKDNDTNEIHPYLFYGLLLFLFSSYPTQWVSINQFLLFL